MTDMKNYTPAVVVYWTESEAGWGQRPDGVTVYRNREDADKGIESYWAAEKKRNPSGKTPAEYSFPGTPRLCAVRNDIYKDIKKKGFHTWKNSPEWLISNI